MKDIPFFFYKEMKLLLFICNWMRIFKSSMYLGIKNEFVNEPKNYTVEWRKERIQPYFNKFWILFSEKAKG